MATFGEELRRLRKEKNITQSALAAAIGTDFTYISKIENGRVTHSPSEGVIKKMAEVLQVDEEQLILLAKKVPQNLKNNLVEDNLAVDFLRVIPKFNQEQRAAIQKIIEDAKENA